MTLSSAKKIAATALLCGFAVTVPAQAEEIYLGASIHAADTPFSLQTDEQGHDVQFGIRGNPITQLSAIGSPSAYLHGQVSLNGETSLAAAGISWKIGHKFYLRPGIGLALHTDKIPEARASGRRIDLGSRVLFEPEVAVGVRLSERLAGEVSWVHVSHATLLSGQNPGMDFIGARLVLSLH